jgi:hypothetical protein
LISNFFFYFHEFKMIKFFWRLFLNPWQIFYFLNKFIDRRVINKIKLRWCFLLCSPTFCTRYLFILWFFLILFLKIGISICKQRFCFIIKFITNINNILALKLFVMNISLIFNHVLNPVIWCYFFFVLFLVFFHFLHFCSWMAQSAWMDSIGLHVNIVPQSILERRTAGFYTRERRRHPHSQWRL